VIQLQVTIITPIAPHHQDSFVRAADSVRKQTVPCRHLHMVDDEMRGPAFIRNKLLQEVKTPFVVFLDADDYLEPDFIYECLRVVRPDRYVYTDWYQGKEVKSTPKGAFWDTAWHLITCLLHTDYVRLVGGFDEMLPVMEDTKLFLEFDKVDYCGIQIKKPLVHYTNEGRRSVEGRASGEVKNVKAWLARRYRVACCGADIKMDRTPIGTKRPGDVLVMPLWEGNRTITGLMTGRRYGRGAKPRKVWMSPKDAKARPDLYFILPNEMEPPKPKKAISATPEVKKPRSFLDMLVASNVLRLPYEAPLPITATEITPDFNKLNEIAQRIYN